MSIIRVWDTETSGLVAPEAQPVEIGWCDLHGDGHEWSPAPPQALLVNPGHPIPIEVTTIHHIEDSDVADAPSLAQVAHTLRDGDPIAFAAFNLDFDRQWYEPPTDLICIYRCAIKLDPKSPKHSNQYLRYRYKLNVDRDLASPPHRAGPDAFVSANILARMLAKHTVAELVAITKEPLILPRMRFGKHAGTFFEELPTDYLQWMVGQATMDADAKRTAAHHLKLRQTDGERR